MASTFDWARYEAMAKVMRGLNAKVTLSINDHPDIRTCFAGMRMEVVPIKYTVGDGAGVDRNELLISSWDVAAEPAGVF